MNIVFTFKNFEPSDHLKQYTQRRLEKLGKYCSQCSPLEAAVFLSVDKFRHRAEVHITGNKLDISANETSEDMYASIDLILDKLEAQIKKHSEKIKDHRRANSEHRRLSQMDVVSIDPEGGTGGHKIVSSNQFENKPLYVDEAAMQLEKSNTDFLVFINADTSKVNVLYKMNNGDFGLIDPEI